MEISQLIEVLQFLGKMNQPAELQIATAGSNSIGAHLIGKRVLVRTYSAGVHFGTLQERDGAEAYLTESRRIWRWGGAFTLSEIAERGLAVDESKISAELPNGLLLTDAIEFIPLSDAADAILRNAPSYKP